jgi:hypothetical protein
MFKKKDIVLDCYTYVPWVYDHAKINYGNKYMPQWWKDTPSRTKNGDDTIRVCQGLIDYYKSGIVIPSWFEIDFHIKSKYNTKENAYTWEASNPAVNTDGSHSSDQWGLYSEDNGNNLKFDSPWIFKTQELVQFTWTQPTWSMRDKVDQITVLPAVVDYKYQHWTNINWLVLNRDEPKDINIPSLTPMVIMHPMTDRNVIIKNHLISKEQWSRIGEGSEYMFLKGNKNIYQSKKRIIDNVEKIEGCPYMSKGKLDE